MIRRGSILVFVLILAALLAVSLLTLIRMVGLSFYSSDDYITESQAYLLARNRLVPDYSEYLLDNQWVLQNQISSENYENFELEGYRSGETYLCRLNALDYNSLFPYVWYPLFEHLNQSSPWQHLLNESVTYVYSSEQTFQKQLYYPEAFLYSPGPERTHDYDPEFFQARQRVDKTLLPSEIKQYLYPSTDKNRIITDRVLEVRNSLDARNSNVLPFFVLPGRQIVNNTSLVQQKLNINTLYLTPGSFIYQNEFYILLRERFPEAQEEELFQYLLNIHYSLGNNNEPVAISLQNGQILDNNYELRDITPSMRMIGRGPNPMINEVWAYTPPANNNDGQFIELYNPFEEEFDLSGWSIVIYEVTNIDSSTPNYNVYGQIHLTQRILQPGEFFLITNDFDDQNDPDSDGYSFFDHLGIYLELEEYEEIPEMELPGNNGRIELWNSEDQFVDYFEYRRMRGENFSGHQSCQRYYPLTGKTYYDYPTPGKKNISTKIYVYPDIQDLLDEDRALHRTRPPLNRLFYNLAEILLVPTDGYLGEFTIAGQTEEFFSPFVLMDKADNKRLTVGVLDLFYIDLVSDEKGNPLGRININTASSEVIERLTNDQVFASQVERYRNMHQNNVPAFLSFGEFFQAPIWKVPENENTGLPFFTTEQIRRFSRFADFITFFSDDYWVQVDLKHFFKDQSGEEEILPPGSEWNADFSFIFRIQRNENF